MQTSNKPGKLTLPFANSGSKNSIPVPSQIGITPGAASYTDGFPPLTMTPLEAGGVPPSGFDFNGVFFAITAALRWEAAGAGYAYDSAFATDSNIGGYPLNALVARSDGKGYWINLAENNTTNPESSGSNWGMAFASGIAAITMTSSNYTLTPLEYGLGIIRITGLLTTNLNLIFPAITGTWLVINATTGNFSITAKTAAGTGVIVGDCGYVACDGTNIISTLATLLNSTNLSQGVALVGGGIRAVKTITDLKACPKTGAQWVFATGYYAQGDGGGGFYYYDAADTTSADNGGTIIVATDGGRWKLDYLNMKMSLKNWGGKSDNGVTNNTVPYNNFLAWAATVASATCTLNLEKGSWYFNTKPNNTAVQVIIKGEGRVATQLYRNYNGATTNDGLFNLAPGANGSDIRSMALISGSGVTGGCLLSNIATSGSAADYCQLHDILITSGGTNTHQYGIVWDGGLRVTGAVGVRDTTWTDVAVFGGANGSAFIKSVVAFNASGLNTFPAGGSSGAVVITGNASVPSQYASVNGATFGDLILDYCHYLNCNVGFIGGNLNNTNQSLYCTVNANVGGNKQSFWLSSLLNDPEVGFQQVFTTATGAAAFVGGVQAVINITSGATVNLTFTDAAIEFKIWDTVNGNGAKVYCEQASATVGIQSVSSTFVNSNTPTSSQIGIFKSSFSYGVSIKNGQPGTATIAVLSLGRITGLS
jgi:hypothetical protein